MSDPNEPYPIEPAPGETPKPVHPSGAEPDPSSPSPAPSSKPKPRLLADRLLDDFEEDADFTADPELDKALGRKPDTVIPPEAGPQAPEFVVAGLGSPKIWAAIGGVLLIGAVIAAGVNTPVPTASQVALNILLTIYDTLLSTGTGVVALFIAARLLEKRFGSVELAAGRMFAAVAAYMFLYNLRIRATGVVWVDNSIVAALAAAAYVLLVAWTFKLWDRIALMYVIGSHLLLWLVMLVGMSLSSAIKTVPESSRPVPIHTSTPADPGAKSTPIR